MATKTGTVKLSVPDGANASSIVVAIGTNSKYGQVTIISEFSGLKNVNAVTKTKETSQNTNEPVIDLV